MPAHSQRILTTELTTERATEVHTAHTQLLRVSLEVEHAQAYWQHSDSARPTAEEPELAFSEYWFGAKSMARVRALTSAFHARFAPFPDALRALCSWSSAEHDSRTLVCHWHLQLTDPIYRTFTGSYLPERRAIGWREISRDPVVRWVGDFDEPNRWSSATRIGFASKLLSAAHRAGLIETTRDPRPLVTPRVPAVALGYLLYLLRETTFTGTLYDNPYLRSVGLEGGLVDDKMRQVPGLDYRRVGNLVDITWHHDDLPSWVSAIEEANT